jgi:hypothetical protein
MASCDVFGFSIQHVVIIKLISKLPLLGLQTMVSVTMVSFHDDRLKAEVGSVAAIPRLPRSSPRRPAEPDDFTFFISMIWTFFPDMFIVPGNRKHSFLAQRFVDENRTRY